MIIGINMHPVNLIQIKNELFISKEKVTAKNIRRLLEKLRFYFQEPRILVLAAAGWNPSIPKFSYENTINLFKESSNNLFSKIIYFEKCMPLHMLSFYQKNLFKKDKLSLGIYLKLYPNGIIITLLINGDDIDASTIEMFSVFTKSSLKKLAGGDSEYSMILNETLYYNYFNYIKPYTKKFWLLKNDDLKINITTLSNTGYEFLKQFVKFFKLKKIIIHNMFEYFQHVKNLTYANELHELNAPFLFSVIEPHTIIFNDSMNAVAWYNNKKKYNPLDMLVKLKAYKTSTIFPYNKISKWTKIDKITDYYVDENQLAFFGKKLTGTIDSTLIILARRLFNKPTQYYYKYQLINISNKMQESDNIAFLKAFNKDSWKKNWKIVDNSLIWVDKSFVLKINFENGKLIAKILIIKQLEKTNIEIVLNWVRMNLLLGEHYEWRLFW